MEAAETPVPKICYNPGRSNPHISSFSPAGSRPAQALPHAFPWTTRSLNPATTICLWPQGSLQHLAGFPGLVAFQPHIQLASPLLRCGPQSRLPPEPTCTAWESADPCDRGQDKRLDPETSAGEVKKWTQDPAPNVGLSDLTNTNAGCPFKSEFQINNKHILV